MTKLLVVVAVIGSASAVAHADGDGIVAQRPADKLELSGTAGFATPVGELGVEGALHLDQYVEVGVGVGLSNLLIGHEAGPKVQLAVMPRLLLPAGPVRFTLGAGVSAGEYADAASPFSSDAYAAETSALWLNGEAGVQYVRKDGEFIGLYVGAGKVVAHGEIRDSHGDKLMTLPDDTLPYLGVKFGRRF